MTTPKPKPGAPNLGPKSVAQRNKVGKQKTLSARRELIPKVQAENANKRIEQQMRVDRARKLNPPKKTRGAM